ncbi:MAG TPA: DNA primase [Gemmataceae bacterium]|nr:DNA primase [Gemmataceae bacterium]
MASDRVALTKQIKDANDIVDVVGSYVSLRPAGATYKGLCPFHDDRRPSFDVDPRRQRYRCWSCGKNGDVITFVQEHDRVDFREALELLARRAGITLEKLGADRQNPGRALMLDTVKWAAEQYHRCLLDSPLAEGARKYLGDRRLTGETIRRFGLGFAPPGGEWLVQRAAAAGHSDQILEEVGLIAKRTSHPNPSPLGGERGWGEGHYDRFRDRVMFPIRDARGQTVGFGGRILPSSPLSEKGPKYYNSSATPLFNKSDALYGLDQARQPGQAAGYLAVVEGYTDVLMAHQAGVAQVVATMGTALNARHVQNLRRFVPRVVLVFDADTGGATGVDRALEIFVSLEVDLAIATLPLGLDPCDFLVQHGPEPFRAALASAVDALDFKLNQLLAAEANAGVEARRRAVDAVLRVVALAPEMAGHAGAVKRDLIVTRIAHQLGIQAETIWGRLKELRGTLRRPDREPRSPEGSATGEDESRQADAPRREKDLLTVLLADPALVSVAAQEIAPEEIEHPELREMLVGLYKIQTEGATPDLDHLRPTIENPRLAAYALGMQDTGRLMTDRPAALRQLFAEFRKRRLQGKKQELQDQLHGTPDHTQAVELLRQLQNQSVGGDF